MSAPKLRFGADGRFRILQVSDFHAGRQFNKKLTAGFEALLQETLPDFVMIGGDQCLEKTSAAAVREYFREILAPVLKRGLPWGVVFGNHDREVGIDLESEMQAYMQLPGCMAEAGPRELPGVGNYCIPIYAADADTVLWHLWAMDTHRSLRDPTPGFGMAPDAPFVLPDPIYTGSAEATVTFEQVRWYHDLSSLAERAAGKKIPGVMFLHIPLPEFLMIVRNPEQCGAIGHMRDTLGCPELSSGLFLAALGRGDIRGFFFGHEHLCDLQGQYCGITMACDAALGYNMSCHDDLRGGRVIDLFASDGSMQTRAVKLMDLMGRGAMRDPDYFEGGCKYHIRKL